MTLVDVCSVQLMLLCSLFLLLASGNALQSMQREKVASSNTDPTNAALQYIFGYGSLICPLSRSLTAPEQNDKVATPVLIRNLERVWTARVEEPKATAMGVRFHPGAETVGVLLPVTDSELELFDVREEGYDRVLLDLEDVHRVPFLTDEHYEHEHHSTFLKAKEESESDPSSGMKIWVYVPQPEFSRPASSEHPIVQSYVDIIVRGCLSISEDFARAFVLSTKGWHPTDYEPHHHSENNKNDDTALDNSQNPIWIDDRKAPVYARADSCWSSEKGHHVDQLFHEIRPHHILARGQSSPL